MTFLYTIVNLKMYSFVSTLLLVFFPLSFCFDFQRETLKMQIQKRIVNGEMFQGNCSVKHPCPSSPPSLHWNKSPFLNDSTSLTFDTLGQGQWWHTETLHGLATYKMHNSKMWCSAKFTKESERTTLNVLCK